jgi:glycosyltransferase involved in cell wall biosynthesis
MGSASSTRSRRLLLRLMRPLHWLGADSTCGWVQGRRFPADWGREEDVVVTPGEDEKVTVVIPSWNAAGTIAAALASVAAQTRQPDAVIVVDDASIDATRAVVAPWVAALPLTIIALDTNAGPAAARDRAIRSATTPLIALLDADDAWLPEHLETLLAARATSGAAIVSPNAVFWDPTRGFGTGTYRDVVGVPPPEQQADDILRRDFVCTGALFERDLYEQAGGFRAEFTGSEPWDLWMRMIDKGARVHGVEHPTYLYRVARMSLSRSPAAFHSAAALFDDVCLQVASDDHRLAIAVHTLREMRARRELFLAYEAAGAGDAGKARRHALAAGRGPIAVRARALALFFAPAAARRWRDRKINERRAHTVSR